MVVDMVVVTVEVVVMVVMVEVIDLVMMMVEVVVMTVLMTDGNDIDVDNLLRPHPPKADVANL